MKYNTIDLLDVLKKEAQKLMPRSKITNELMSKLLTGTKGRHYEIKKTLVKSYKKKKKRYLIAEDVLERYIANLKSHFMDRYNYANFDVIIKKYIQANTLKKFAKSTLNHNPNLDLNYFNIIDSKEKAYWLGWIFAEGHITKKNGLQIEIGIVDEILVIRFARAIGFDVSNIIYKNRIRENRLILNKLKNAC